MTTFEDELEMWNNYFYSTRQVGHTTTCIQGVENVKGSILVCAHHQHADIIQRQYNTPAIAFSIPSDKLLFMKNPVVFDNYTIHIIIQRSLTSRIDREKVRHIIDKVSMGNNISKDELLKELGL